MESQEWVSLGKDRPVSWKEGDYTVTRSTVWSPPGCHDGCSVLYYTNNEGKLVKVEGDPEAPYNQGRLCARCLDLPEVVYSDKRILHPMKRAKEDRGQDKWVEITWEQAYSEIVEKFKAIEEEHGPESVLFLQGTGRDVFPYKTRLAWSFGSPNAGSFLGGSACYTPRIASIYGMTGSFWVADCAQNFPDRYDNPEYRLTDTMIIWGNNPIVSNGDGFFGHWVVDLMRRGTKLIVVDPRLTWLASKATVWLQLRPGTDAALAMAMNRIIIEEELYDKEFVDKWVYGFDEFYQACCKLSVKEVSKITFVPEEKIYEAARMFAHATPGSIQMGVAMDQGNSQAIPSIQAICGLMVICGDLDVPGGMIAPHFILNSGFGWGAELLSDEQYQKRIGLKEYPLIGHSFTIMQTDTMMSALFTDMPYPVRGIWMQSSNPLANQAASPREVLDGMLKMDINVYVDLFMTPTCMATCDYFLPISTCPERNGLRTCDGPQFGATMNQVIEPLGETKPEMTIDREIGHMLNPEAWPWKSDKEMFSSMIKNSYIGDITFDELKQDAPVYKKVQYRKYEKGLMRPDGQIGFNTSTGRIELYSLMYQKCDVKPLPYYVEPKPGPVSTPLLAEKYPLILTTGARDWFSFHSEHRQIPHLRAMKPWPIAKIHPETARKYGIEDGAWIWVENHLGRAKRKACVTYEVPEWLVSTDHGWWFPEKRGDNPDNNGIWEYNINQLIPSHNQGDAGLGENYKALLCTIYKVEGGE